MSLTLKAGSSKTYEPAPAGTHVAVCVAVVDLGTQTVEYQGETKQQKKLLLTFELNEDAGLRDDGEPWRVSKRYTASLHEKAALRKDLQSWRGKDFTAVEAEAFDVGKLLGKVAMISIAHVTNGDKTYANIAAIMGAPKGVSMVPKQQPYLLDLSPDKFNHNVYVCLSEGLQKVIAAAPEFKEVDKPQAQEPASKNPMNDPDDDVQF